MRKLRLGKQEREARNAEFASSGSMCSPSMQKGEKAYGLWTDEDGGRRYLFHDALCR